MYLAWKEIMRSKGRYAGVLAIIILIAYLVFFLFFLASGLSTDMRSGVDKTKADSIVLSASANENLNASQISTDELADIRADQQTALHAGLGSSELKDSTRVDMNFFGIDPEGFLLPDVTEGKNIDSSSTGVVVDDSLKELYSLEIGDQFTPAQSDTALTVIGFTHNAKLSTVAIAYMTAATYLAAFPQADPEVVNAVLIQGNATVDNKDLSDVPIADFISSIPGYTAQKSTFYLMIMFLIIISAIILAVFMYILTMQKTQVYGVMKAQGVPDGYITGSVLIQNLLIATAGVAFALILVVLSSLLLPDQIPFQLSGSQALVLSLIMIATAVLGGLFSVRRVSKIEPLIAMRG